MQFKTAREGWLLIDNRLAPPEPGFPRFLEAGTITCTQCQKQMIRNPERMRERAHCSKCGYLCDGCAVLHKLNGCKPFSKVIDEVLEQAARGVG